MTLKCDFVLVTGNQVVNSFQKLKDDMEDFTVSLVDKIGCEFTPRSINGSPYLKNLMHNYYVNVNIGGLTSCYVDINGTITSVIHSINISDINEQSLKRFIEKSDEVAIANTQRYVDWHCNREN